MDPTLRTIRTAMRFRWERAAPRLGRIALSAVMGFLPLMLISSGQAERYDPAILSLWYQQRGKRPPPTAVSIARLDKPAFTKAGAVPGQLFPRRALAEGIRKIAAAGAKLIVIDGVAQHASDDPTIDEDLAEAFRSVPTVIMRSSETVTETDLDGNQRYRKIRNENIEILEKSASAVIKSHFRLLDGVVREISLSNDRDVFSAERVPLLKPLQAFVSSDIEQPGGFDFINFYGPPASIPSVSFADLLGPMMTTSPDFFKDRVVFIGGVTHSSGGVEAGKDTFRTPVSSELMYGVEIHATIAANLIDRSWIRRPNATLQALSVVLVVFLCSLFILYLTPVLATLLVAIVCGSWTAASYYAFSQMNLYFPALIFCTAMLLTLSARWVIAALAARRRHR